MKITAVYLFILALLTIACPHPAQAWLRVPYEDAQIVQRSELIVVGAIKEDSVVVVPHTHKPGEGASWETHATLIIHEVIKGETKEKELPIVIGYGLDVFSDGKRFGEGSLEKPTTVPSPKNALSIVDTGGDRELERMGDDVRKDHLWFLHRDRTGGEGAQPDDKSLGIVDPEDVQPLDLKSYFQCYLSPDPQAGVRLAMQTQPQIAARAVHYLEHQQIERILKEKDPAVRVELLLPYYVSRCDWGYKYEARDGIIAAGEIAGPYLMALYDDPRVQRQDDIVLIWGEIHYKPCVPILIEGLKRADKFWAAQDLKPGWGSANIESPQTEARRESEGMVYYSVYALGEIADPSAREVLVSTRSRWATIPDNTQIVEACDQALKALPGKMVPGVEEGLPKR